jgi:hypothetical protein
MVFVEMAITINLTGSLTARQEKWLIKNVGPRMFYIHNSIGGQGWIAKRQSYSRYSEPSTWTLTLEDDKLATFFVIKFSS